MNTSSLTKRTYLSVLLAATLLAGCGDTINLFNELRDSGSGNPDDGWRVDSGSGIPDSGSGNPDDGWRVDSGSGTPDGGSAADAALADANAATTPDSECEELGSPSAGALPGGTPCDYRLYACTEAGTYIETHVSLAGCDANGTTGDPSSTVSTPAEALQGDSGQSCESSFSYARPTADPYCIDLALCGETLAVGRVCASKCDHLPVSSAPKLNSCNALAERLSETPAGVSLVGSSCAGEFICGSAGEDLRPGEAGGGFDSLGSGYFCAEGALQVFTLGPAPLYVQE